MYVNNLWPDRALHCEIGSNGASLFDELVLPLEGREPEEVVVATSSLLMCVHCCGAGGDVKRIQSA